MKLVAKEHRLRNFGKDYRNTSKRSNSHKVNFEKLEETNYDPQISLLGFIFT